MSNDTPWWVTTIYKIGVPTAIAIYLVYILAAKVLVHLEAVDNNVMTHISKQDIHYINQEKQLQLLRFICAQGAKNATDRRQCFE